MSLALLLHPGRWTLRARLIAALAALLAAVVLVVGVVSVALLQRQLVDRLDEQLASSAEGRDMAAGAPEGLRERGAWRWPGASPPPGGVSWSSREGELWAQVVGGKVQVAHVLAGDESVRDVSAEVAAALDRLPAGPQPATVDLGAAGDYRVSVERDGDVLVLHALPLGPVRATVQALAVTVAVVGLVGLALAALAGAAIVRLSLRPLRRVAATATEVSRLPLHSGQVALAQRVPASGTDPRTEVGAAVNRLLEHVAAALSARQASETRVRQFVADASHELRTPLASIRGYAELTRRSREPVPPDVAHALRRVESEAVRMTSLVEDLLLLARLDAGRPVAREPVDLTALLVDAVSDAHAAGPGHRWDLDLPDEPVVVPGDGARLHQVLANVLANARVHTPPGTCVTTALAREGGRAVVRVEDDGPGIAPQLLPDVFERFARGDEGRTRAAGHAGEGSTGLGLAIVAAVVAAHGGTVGVDSRPGRTAFTVRLPLAAAPPAAPWAPAAPAVPAHTAPSPAQGAATAPA